MSLSLSVPLSMCLNQHAFSNQQLPSMLANEVVDFEMTNCINLWCWQIFHSIPYVHLCTETRLFKILKDCTRCDLLSDLYSEYINVEVHVFNPLMCNTKNRKQVVSKSVNFSSVYILPQTWCTFFFNYGSKFIKEFSTNQYQLIYFIFTIKISSRWLKK